MKSDLRGRLRIPQGTEGFYLDEAYRHNMLTADVQRLLYQWGYLPVQTPVFDFYDSYAGLLSAEESRNIYRLIDREGDLLMLRSDVTLFLAKQMGMILAAEDLPMRVCYADTILRHQHPDDISKNEFFQTGVELIGPADINADAEVILLLQRALETIGIHRHFIHVGSRALFNVAFPDLEPQSARVLRRAVVLRDTQTIRDVCSGLGVRPDRTKLLMDLFAFIGSDREFAGLTTRYATLFNEAERAEITRLRSLAGLVSEAGDGERIRIDLSEIGSQPYHTGVVFQAYVDGLDSSVAAGGRYDRLYGVFGFDVPAVGFSVMLRKLQEQTAGNDRYAPPQPARANGTAFIERVRDAEARRSRGESVSL